MFRNYYQNRKPHSTICFILGDKISSHMGTLGTLPIMTFIQNNFINRVFHGFDTLVSRHNFCMRLENCHKFPVGQGYDKNDQKQPKMQKNSLKKINVLLNIKGLSRVI